MGLHPGTPWVSNQQCVSPLLRFPGSWTRDCLIRCPKLQVSSDCNVWGGKWYDPLAKTPGNKRAVEFRIFQILEGVQCIYSTSCNSYSKSGVVPYSQICSCFCGESGNIRIKTDKDSIQLQLSAGQVLTK